MEFLSELEGMALNTMDFVDETVAADDIRRWGKVFGLSLEEAESQISVYRSDFGRKGVSDEHWDLVFLEMENQGHNRESYEYSLAHIKPTTQSHLKRQSPNSRFILRLEGPVNTPESVQEYAGLIIKPNILFDDETQSRFVVLTACEREKLETAVSAHYKSFRPLFIKISMANKELLTYSVAPKLGFDTTLPHHRPTLAAANLKPCYPAAGQYPVVYFFYGTLAEPTRLKALLGLSSEPELARAKVFGGVLKQWGTYKALEDGPNGSKVDGHMFELETEAQEDILRCYETEKYEVVRCDIQAQNRLLPGLTFRFLAE